MQARAAGTAGPPAGCSVRYDQEKTARTSVVGVAAGERVQVACRASRSSAASAASGKPGLVAARAATIASASGSRAHRSTISSTASGSAATRSAPSRRASSSRASSARRAGPAASGCAPSAATRPGSWLRLVTRTRQPGAPGSSGRTCSASRALSSTTSIRRPASRLRYRAGLRRQAGRDARRRHAERVEEAAQRLGRADIGRAVGVEAAQVDVELAVRETGRRTRCAQCTASAVLPTPADAGQHGDRDGGRLLVGAGPQRVEVGQLAGPAGEPVDVQRQLRRHGTRRARSAGVPGGRRWPAVAGASAGAVSSSPRRTRLVQAAQLGARVGTELVGELPLGRARTPPAPRRPGRPPPAPACRPRPAARPAGTR